MPPCPGCTDQVSVDDPEVPAATGRRDLQERSIATFGKRPRCLLQALPVPRSIGVVAERAGHVIRVPQGCSFGAPPQEVEASVLFAQCAVHVVVLLWAA